MIQYLEVDNNKVRNQQIERINKLKAKRNSEKVKKALSYEFIYPSYKLKSSISNS